jgi:hypothetical protein
MAWYIELAGASAESPCFPGGTLRSNSVMTGGPTLQVKRWLVFLGDFNNGNICYEHRRTNIQSSENYSHFILGELQPQSASHCFGMHASRHSVR